MKRNYGPRRVQYYCMGCQGKFRREEYKGKPEECTLCGGYGPFEKAV